jgi:hypothetical protein
VSVGGRFGIRERGKIEAVGKLGSIAFIASIARGWTRLEGRRTCQTKGRFLRFAKANTIAAILHRPPGSLNLVHLANVTIRAARKEGCDVRAANDAPATTMLTACAIVTISVQNHQGKKEQ